MRDFVYTIGMGSWLWFKKNTLQEVIAIDVGTASISAVLAHKGAGKLIEIVSVLRYPFDLLYDASGIERHKRMLHVFGNAFAKVFADMRHISSSNAVIYISFADPYFEERDFSTVIHRSDPKKSITREEIDTFLKNTENWKRDNASNKKELQLTLVTVRRDVVELKVNGYPLKEIIGYHGGVLEIRVRELAISQTLQNIIQEQKEKFYLRNTLEYFSDLEILKRAMYSQHIAPTPFMVIDIGGEVTSLFIVQDAMTTQRCASVYLGLRTLERRISAFLKTDSAHAETILKQYSGGFLDDSAFMEKIKTIVDDFLQDWYDGINLSLKNLGIRHEIAKIMVVGSGRDARFFIDYLSIHAGEFSESESSMPTEIFSVADNLFLPEKSLSQGGDVVLASLLLYAG